MKRLGAQIRAYRKAAGMTLEQLAGKLEVSYRTVADIERGLQFTSLGNLYQISKAVGCDLPDLFSWASSKTNPNSEELAPLIDRIADELAKRKTSGARKTTGRRKR